MPADPPPPPPPPVAGYSGKPLFLKLGLRPGLTCIAIDPPDQYPRLIAEARDVTFFDAQSGRCADVVHLFCRGRADLDASIAAALALVAPKGMLWVSWPKKSSPLYRDLGENDLRTVILPLGWVDVKVCAIDADWSGLKFLHRVT